MSKRRSFCGCSPSFVTAGVKCGSADLRRQAAESHNPVVPVARPTTYQYDPVNNSSSTSLHLAVDRSQRVREEEIQQLSTRWCVRKDFFVP
jgi:hypothetical protein